MVTSTNYLEPVLCCLSHAYGVLVIRVYDHAPKCQPANGQKHTRSQEWPTKMLYITVNVIIIKLILQDMYTGVFK